MSSALRFRPRRSASASRATWSLTPSTSTTARGSAPVASACAAAPTSGVPPPPSAGSTAGGWNRRLSFTCLVQKVYVERVHSLVLFARHPQLLRFRYDGQGRVHFPRCRLSRRLAGQVGFGAPRDSRASLGGKGPVLYRILDTHFRELRQREVQSAPARSSRPAPCRLLQRHPFLAVRRQRCLVFDPTILVE